MSKYEGQVEVVCGVMIIHDDKVLLIQSPKWGDHWLFPGGHVEYGETLFQTAEREGLEEIGISMKAEAITSFGEDIFLPEYHRKAHMIYFHVLCRAETEDVKVDPGEITSARWYSKEEALALAVFPDVHSSIERWAKGISFPHTSRTGTSKQK